MFSFLMATEKSAFLNYLMVKQGAKPCFQSVTFRIHEQLELSTYLELSMYPKINLGF